jgi:hypothetical protein
VLRHIVPAIVLTLSCSAALAAAPIKVLIVSGGCCHDYPAQRQILEEGLKARLNVTVTHLYYDPKPGEQATRPKLPIFTNPHYGDGFDVIIHDECAADESDPAALDAVLAPHRKGVPGVNLHCAMHSYRSGTWQQPVKAGDANARWFEYTGIQSTGHGLKTPITLTPAAGQPIMAGIKGWVTGPDELYNNWTTFDVTPVLQGVQLEAADPADRSKVFTVAWTHTYGPAKARVFSMTLTHFESAMREPTYLDIVARGVAWATGHLSEDGKIEAGYAK